MSSLLEDVSRIFSMTHNSFSQKLKTVSKNAFHFYSMTATMSKLKVIVLGNFALVRKATGVIIGFS